MDGDRGRGIHGSGVLAGSPSPVTLGADSVIELVCAVVLLWRPRIELQQDAEFPRPLESEPAKSPFCSLTAYAIASAGDGLSARSARLPMRSATVILALARMMTLRLA